MPHCIGASKCDYLLDLHHPPHYIAKVPSEVHLALLALLVLSVQRKDPKHKNVNQLRTLVFTVCAIIDFKSLTAKHCLQLRWLTMGDKCEVWSILGRSGCSSNFVQLSICSLGKCVQSTLLWAAAILTGSSCIW